MYITDLKEVAGLYQATISCRGFAIASAITLTSPQCANAQETDNGGIVLSKTIVAYYSEQSEDTKT